MPLTSAGAAGGAATGTLAAWQLERSRGAPLRQPTIGTTASDASWRDTNYALRYDASVTTSAKVLPRMPPHRTPQPTSALDGDGLWRELLLRSTPLSSKPLSANKRTRREQLFSIYHSY